MASIALRNFLRFPDAFATVQRYLSSGAISSKRSDRILVFETVLGFRCESLYYLIQPAEECDFANNEFVIDRK
jgi:hypothetical protein